MVSMFFGGISSPIGIDITIYLSKLSKNRKFSKPKEPREKILKNETTSHQPFEHHKECRPLGVDT